MLQFSEINKFKPTFIGEVNSLTAVVTYMLVTIPANFNYR